MRHHQQAPSFPWPIQFTGPQGNQQKYIWFFVRFSDFCLGKQKLLGRFHYREIVKLSPMGRMIDRRTHDGPNNGWGNYFLFPQRTDDIGQFLCPSQRSLSFVGCAGPVDHHKLTITLILSFVGRWNRGRMTDVCSSPGHLWPSSLLQNWPFPNLFSIWY